MKSRGRPAKFIALALLCAAVAAFFYRAPLQRWWRLHTVRGLRAEWSQEGMVTFCISPDSKMVAIGSSEPPERSFDPEVSPLLMPLGIYSTADGHLLHALPFAQPMASACPMGFSADNRQVAVYGMPYADGVARTTEVSGMYDIADGTRMDRWSLIDSDPALWWLFQNSPRETRLARCQSGSALKNRYHFTLLDGTFSACGGRMALCNAVKGMFIDVRGARLQLYDIDDRKLMWDVPAPWARYSAFSPDGNMVAVATDCPRYSVMPATRLKPAPEKGAVFGYDAANGHELWHRDFDKLLHGVDFSPDGRLLAVGCGSRDIVWLLDSRTGELVRKLEPDGESNVEAPGPFALFSPDGKVLATRCRDTVRLWDTSKLVGGSG